MRFYRETSLQGMCLSVIISNFDSITHVSENQKSIVLLRKVFSDKIYSILKKRALLKEKHTQWLISPYWRDIIIERNYDINEFIPKLRLCGASITSISLKDSLASEKILSAVVCCIPNVKSLNLNCTCSTDTLLQLIRKMCPVLRELSLYDCRGVSQQGMYHLCYSNGEKIGYDSLKVLNIERTHIKPAGVIFILENLNLYDLKYHDLPSVLYQYFHDIQTKEKKTLNLMAFDYFVNRTKSSVSLADSLQSWVNLCPSVQKITTLSWVTEKDFNLLSKFQELKYLTIAELSDLDFPFAYYPAPEHGLSGFLEVRGEKLVELILQNGIIAVEIIAKTCKNLERLTLANLNYVDFSETKAKAFEDHLKKLYKLSLNNCKLTNMTTYKSVCFLLNACTNVEKLTFRYCEDFPDEFFSSIIKMHHLVKLKFTFTSLIHNCTPNQFTCNNIINLFQCKNILKLYFNGCPNINTEHYANYYMDLNRFNFGNTLSWQVDYMD